MSAAAAAPIFAQLPPSYSGYAPPPDEVELPAYTPGRNTRAAAAVSRPEPKEFYHEIKKKGKPFAILTIISEGSYSKIMPTFIEGTPIRGRVRLSMDRPDNIQSVVVSVRGQMITGANQGEQLTFVDIQRTLWSQSDGEPQNTSSDNGDSTPVPSPSPESADSSGNPPQSPKFAGKLQGDYTWQFSIELPKQVVLPYGPRNEPQVFEPPQTFNERHARASICYEVSLRLHRGKLRTDYRIPAQFGFISAKPPPPFPPLRRLAYLEGSPILGPIVDPDGWHSPDSIQIKISVFGNRTIQVRCSLYLAKPLSYTRGSSIPFCLRLESPDEQALDLLSSPKAIVLRLRRRLKSHWNPEKTLESSAWKDAIDHSQLATWWPSTETPDIRGVRYINGELHLKPDASPSSAMGHFRIEYSAVLFPFDAPGITSEDTEPLVEQSLEIVNVYAPGPRPRMLAPPGYEDSSPIPDRSYGFLPNRMVFL